MDAECKLESNGTIFRFCITEKGYNDGGYFWTNAAIYVSNWCLNYRTSSEFLEFSELIELRDKLTDLINDNLNEIEHLEFIEPDIQVLLKPRHDIRNDGKYEYIKGGYEIEDIVAEFLLYPVLDDAFTDQHYVMPLYRQNIAELLKYLDNMIAKLK
ncbi:hypothetical protein [Ethanoligenens sp.]|uniref:WapI family immunity protein n=1 Tax=Ethanoligenens sp. TaxID=2099655 RepID=UPI0039E7E207